MAVVVAAEHADVRPRTSWSRPLRPPAVVLHIEPARCGIMARDLVYALAELRIRVWLKAGADAGVRRVERLPAVFAEIVPARRDAEMHAIAVADDRVHAEPAGARLPLARVLVVADAGHDLPRIAAVEALEERCRLDAGPQLLLRGTGLDRPDVLQPAA